MILFRFTIFIIVLFIGNGVMAEEEKATFAGGCFWCMQPVFDKATGVLRTVVGYSGGAMPNPDYESVCSGKTGHAESIEILYDSSLISYRQLLELFLTNIDPFDAGGQFYDRGSEYRTVIFYHTEAQAFEAKKYVAFLEGQFKKNLAVGIEQAQIFYPAEDYHQKYYEKNPGNYNMYKLGSGREQKIKKLWEDQ